MLYTFEQWELDVERHELRRAGQLMKLEPQVFSVLTYLVAHRDRVLSKQELLSHLWPDQHVGDSALERCIMAARKAVGDSGEQQRVIKTFHRRGYRFVVPVTEHLPSAAPLAPTEPIASQQRHKNDNADDKPLSSPVAFTLDNASISPGKTLETPVDPVFAHRKITVLSCAIAHAPEDFKIETSKSLTHDLQPLLDPITAYVQSQGGIIALYRDHGLFALFGLSEPDGDTHHALQAVKVAMALQTSLEKTHFGLDVVHRPLQLRMGLHSGDIIGKRFGDDPHRIYMAMGKTLQFAANLQACTLPGVILASEATYRLVQHAVCGKVAGLITLESGLCHMTAYRLASVLRHADCSPSLPVFKASES